MGRAGEPEGDGLRESKAQALIQAKEQRKKGRGMRAKIQEDTSLARALGIPEGGEAFAEARSPEERALASIAWEKGLSGADELAERIAAGIGSGSARVWALGRGEPRSRQAHPEGEILGSLSMSLARRLCVRAERGREWSAPTVWIWDGEDMEAPGWSERALLGGFGEGGAWTIALAREPMDFLFAPKMALVRGGVAMLSDLLAFGDGPRGAEKTAALERALDGASAEEVGHGWVGPKRALRDALGGNSELKPGKRLEDALAGAMGAQRDSGVVGLDVSAPPRGSAREFALGQGLSEAEREALGGLSAALLERGSEEDMERLGFRSHWIGEARGRIARGMGAQEACAGAAREAAGSSRLNPSAREPLGRFAERMEALALARRLESAAKAANPAGPKPGV